MKNQKDNLLLYAFIGVGYLLFCSAVPSFLSIRYAAYAGGEINNYYVPLAFVTGIFYVVMIFSLMREKMELTARISIKGIAGALFTAAVLFIVINFIVSPFLSALFPDSAGNYDSSVTDMMKTPVATFFQVVIVAPLFEEVIFRGFILKRALRTWSVPVSVMITAVLFGILHMNVVQGLSAAAAGIVLCIFYVRRQSVGLNILAHSIYNGMVFAMALLIR